MSARPAKKSRPQSASAQAPSATAANPQRGTVPGLAWLIALIALAAAEVGLAVYQWSELFTLRAGGDVACSVSEQVNCATVWNSAFANRVHELLGLPVAALGVVWGLTALAVAAILLVRVRSGREPAPLIAAVRLVAAAGALSCITFAVASLRSGAVCPTCLGTYALVLGFAAAAFAGLGSPLVPPSDLLPRALAWSVVPAVLFFVALLVAGRQDAARYDRQGHGAEGASPPPRPRSRRVPLNEREQQVAAFLETLSPAEQQGLAGALAAYKVTPVTQAPAHQPRRLHGSSTAPMRLVEWTDGLCPHCGQLVGRLAELKRVLPARPDVAGGPSLPAGRGVQQLGAASGSHGHPLRGGQGADLPGAGAGLLGGARSHLRRAVAAALHGHRARARQQRQRLRAPRSRRASPTPPPRPSSTTTSAPRWPSTSRARRWWS